MLITLAGCLILGPWDDRGDKDECLQDEETADSILKRKDGEAATRVDVGACTIDPDTLVGDSL